MNAASVLDIFSVPIISRIESIGGGQPVGGWREEVVGGKVKAGQRNHSDSSSSAVPLVWSLNWYNPQGGPRLPLGAVLYPIQSY